MSCVSNILKVATFRTQNLIKMYSKTLGTEKARLFTTLAGQGRIVFSIREAQKGSGKGYSATLYELRRLIRAGWLVKLREMIGPGYALLDPLLRVEGHSLASWRVRLTTD
jgi:hypothetical protein